MGEMGEGSSDIVSALIGGSLLESQRLTTKDH